MTNENLVTPDTSKVAFESSTEALTVALKSINPIIWVRTHEEARFISEITEISKELKMQTYAWSAWQGLVPIDKFDSGKRAEGAFDKTWQPPTALDKIVDLEKKDSMRGNIVVMRDIHFVLQEPIPRQIRDLIIRLSKNQTKLVFVSPTLAHGAGGNHEGVPPTMEKQITVIDFDLPTKNQIKDTLRTLVTNVINKNSNTLKEIDSNSARAKKIQEVVTNLQHINEEHYDTFARALQGLTLSEVNNTAFSSIQHLKTIATKFLMESKKQILARSDILEYFEPNKTMSDIGGMDLLKSFFEDYKYSHTQEAIDFGVEPLRGVLMVGVPGCGKSQMCKAVASSWQLPLIRLDVGKVMTGIVGGSEGKMRAAIKQIEAISPCVLWIDEVEKALSGTKSSNFSDGGTMARVFGTLLTAMEEGLKGVTILATANDIAALPPEFIRRFSEVFFVDLPGPEERTDIFKIHLRRKVADIADLNVDSLIEKSTDFTGSEIEKAVVRSMAFAFKDPDKKLKTEHLLDALSETKPISMIMADKINDMRSQARSKYRYASTWAQNIGQKKQAKKKAMSIGDVSLPELKNKNKNNNVQDESDDDELQL